MKRIIPLFSLFVAFVLIVSACGEKSAGDQTKGGSHSLQGEFITILTGGSSGVYFPLGGTLAKIYTNMGATANSQSTAASATNATTLNQGKAEVAFAMGDTIADAYEGVDSFAEQGAQENLRTIASLYTNYLQIVARKDASIETVEDLKGKTIAVGAPGSGTEISAQRVLAAYDMTYDDVTADYLSFSEGVEGIKNRNVDAIVISSGLPNAGILELATTEEVTIVEIEEEKIVEMEKDYPAYFPTKVPSETYGGMEEDVQTIGVNNVLMTHSDVPDEVVYEMTKGLFENISEMQDSHHAAKDIRLENALDHLPTPLHPGAEQFYDEEGMEEK
ncbi:MAG TPA: TAXI family TRAP transporter solute-binding subunit [Bacillota bacterium]